MTSKSPLQARTVAERLFAVRPHAVEGSSQWVTVWSLRNLRGSPGIQLIREAACAGPARGWGLLGGGLKSTCPAGTPAAGANAGAGHEALRNDSGAHTPVADCPRGTEDRREAGGPVARARADALAVSRMRGAAGDPTFDHADERTWRHLDTCQFQTHLHAEIPRVQCLNMVRRGLRAC